MRFLGWPAAVLATLITVALQAAIMVTQAARSARAVSALLDGSGDRGAAADGFRTYMMMLLTGAPVLIDDPIARHFLEQAQYLGGRMARTLSVIDKAPDGAAVPDKGPKKKGLQDAVQQLQSAAAPLLQLLSPDVRDAVAGIGQTAEE